MRLVNLIPFALVTATAACKPPPTDADMMREMPEAAPTFASEPLPSPDTEGAIWVLSQRTEGRLIFGIPGEPSMLSLDCDTSSSPTIRITRNSPADEGAGALLAIIGNGHIGRIKVDATEIGDASFWVGEAPARDEVWEPLSGPREVTVTVPGAGMVSIGPSPAPALLVAACRAGAVLDRQTLIEAKESEETATEVDASPVS